MKTFPVYTDGMSADGPRYPGLLVDATPILPLLFSVKHRSVHADSVRIASRLSPPLVVHGHIPNYSRTLFLINHYGRPGFPSWWIGIALSSVIVRDIHWVMTAAWEFERGVRARVLTPLTRWLFTRLARVYDFTTMPPMPPRPHQLRERAQAMRQVLRVVGMHPEIHIGLAPEGDDNEQRILGTPPPGAGRFIHLLCSRNLIPVPVGIYEQDGKLHLNIGAPFLLPSPSSSRTKNDIYIINAVMTAIAACLPDNLRGDYA